MECTIYKKFVDEPSNEYELQKDDGINEEIKTPRFQHAFRMLCIQKYLEFTTGDRVDVVPEACNIARGDWIGVTEETSYIARFEMCFELSGKKTDFTPSSEIDNWVNTMGLGITPRKFVFDLKRHCASNPNIYNDKKTTGNKSIRGWFGIRDKRGDVFTNNGGDSAPSIP